MLDTLTRDDFAARLRETFRLRLDASSLDLELISAELLGSGHGRSDHRQPFSLIFRGPKAPVLAQRTYQLENPTMGTLGIFLVPIGPDQTGMRYEAIFA
jgi:uncharacterized protein DUF6916